jgi:hypothetical protein
METNNNLVYFTDLEKDTNIRVGISALVGKLSSKLTSHKSGWAFHLANQLKHAGYSSVSVITDNSAWKADDFDVILIEHGMEFKGNFNIFGGANDDLYHQIIRMFAPGIRMYSLHHDMPCVGTLIEKRLKTGSDLFKTLEVQIEDAKVICASIPRVDKIQNTDKLCFGDSHSFSQYTPGYMTDRHDGLTLFGTLRRGIRSYVPESIKSLRIYLGNIDIRHHLMRQDNPAKSLKEMVSNYEQQLIDLEIDDIEVIQALPIENESRPLPKTGYYKDTPFMGSWAERTELVKEFNRLIREMCTRNEWKTWKHPEVFYNSFGELTFDVMEKPKSVHIAREYYRWDLVNDEPNKKLIKVTQALF